MISLRALREKTAWRATAPAILIVLNTFAWYILTYTVFSETLNGLTFNGNEKLGLFTIYYIGVAVSALVGSKIFPCARAKSLGVWLFMGAIATSLLFFIPYSSSLLMTGLLAFFFGSSVGIGLPSCLSFFAEATSVENRGFVGGLTWSAVGFTVLVFAFSLSLLGTLETILALAGWRLLGGAGFLILNKKQKDHTCAVQESISYLELVRKRELLLYLVPWILLSLINFAEAPLVETSVGRVFGEAAFPFFQLVGFVFIGSVAVIGGTIADLVGRKRVVIAGFVMLGIEYAALSAFLDSPATLYLFLILDGITWGLLVSVFFTAVWGDLSENRVKEKYYLLGGLPYLLSNFMYVVINPIAGGISLTAAFSFASFFLFLAVLPLMYAPETLPEKILKERELKNYIEKAKKEATKVLEKEDENPEREDTDDGVEIKANQDLEEILKAAEKYS
jgi:MFS family permease